MSADLYCRFFGFSERPFSLSPDPDFLFWTRVHSRAFTVLEYGLVTHAPLTVLTGEVGTGKTTLIQQLLRQVDSSISVGLISNAQGNRDDLLRWILNALDIEYITGSDYVELFQRFQDYVIESYSEGRRVVIVIDEAQNLGMETLEELRMLTNINSGKDELLQLILVGQPELREMIERPELRQFAQRVTATYHIQPLDKPTTLTYINNRLTTVGGTGEEIDPVACDKIFEMSEGIPRIINKICDLALVYAASADKGTVDVIVLEELISDGVILQTVPVPLFLKHRVDDLKKAAQ
jgi:type II secretory pathway predicted ATPase ExeA